MATVSIEQVADGPPLRKGLRRDGPTDRERPTGLVDSSSGSRRGRLAKDSHTRSSPEHAAAYPKSTIRLHLSTGTLTIGWRLEEVSCAGLFTPVESLQAIRERAHTDVPLVRGMRIATRSSGVAL